MSTESHNAIVETARSSSSQARKGSFFTQFFTKESEAYLKCNTVNLAPSILLILDFHISSVSPKFFLLVGQLVHFFLCFKLHGIIFCLFETKIEGAAMQTNN